MATRKIATRRPREPSAAKPDRPEPQAPALSAVQSGLINALLTAFWSGLVVMIFASSMEESALRPHYIQRVFLQTLSPQGWAFFTRNPREPWYHAFMVAADGHLIPAETADYRGAPWHGVRRDVRNRGIAIGQVLKAVPSTAWKPCKEAIETCIARVDEGAVEVSLAMIDNTGFCGRVVLQERATVPWAWRKAYRTVHMRSRIALVDVNCTSPRRAH
jgi:antimicrobial peptide system SdpA family protein